MYADSNSSMSSPQMNSPQMSSPGSAGSWGSGEQVHNGWGQTPIPNQGQWEPEKHHPLDVGWEKMAEGIVPGGWSQKTQVQGTEVDSSSSSSKDSSPQKNKCNKDRKGPIGNILLKIYLLMV